MDATLSALLEAAASAGAVNDPATIAALANRLMEVSAQDRIDAIARLADDASRFAMMRERGGNPLVNNLTQRFRVQTERHPDFGSADDAYLNRDLLFRAVKGLFEAIEQDHWYAIRLERVVEPPQPGGPLWRQAEIIRLVVSVTPLDGGRITEPK